LRGHAEILVLAADERRWTQIVSGGQAIKEKPCAMAGLFRFTFFALGMSRCLVPVSPVFPAVNPAVIPVIVPAVVTEVALIVPDVPLLVVCRAIVASQPRSVGGDSASVIVALIAAELALILPDGAVVLAKLALVLANVVAVLAYIARLRERCGYKE
jgi:hypothetical protein